MTESTIPHRCAFVAIVGAPNAGKSTLMNKLVGQKISIVSPRVQTTRTRILGVVIKDDSQLVFIDTPGIFETNKKFEKSLVKNAWHAQHDVDFTMLTVDVSKKASVEQATLVLNKLSNKKNLICVLNKIDMIDRPQLLTLAQQFWDIGVFQEIFMISAKTGEGTDKLLSYLAQKAPIHPWHFPSDQVSDLSLRLLAAEITREQLFHQLHDEVPHDSMVMPETWQSKQNGDLVIHQIIYVTRPGQKAIMIGEKGQKIRSIRLGAQHQLSEILQAKVHLYLKVEVYPKWREDKKLLEFIGFI